MVQIQNENADFIKIHGIQQPPDDQAHIHLGASLERIVNVVVDFSLINCMGHSISSPTEIKDRS